MNTSVFHNFRLGTLSAVSCLVMIAMHSSRAASATLFDFTARSDATRWQVVNDDVMGGVSTSGFRLTNGWAVFDGEVSLDNNGGFASVRSLPSRMDLGGSSNFVIRVRGDGHQYQFTLRTDSRFDSPLYQLAFTTTQGQWQEHRLPVGKFVPTWRGRVLTDAPPLDPGKVTSAGFLIADKQAGQFRLEIAWIKTSQE
jgi:monofunctional biosynthetic peptidoglycan transglycosylase